MSKLADATFEGADPAGLTVASSGGGTADTAHATPVDASGAEALLLDIPQGATALATLDLNQVATAGAIRGVGFNLRIDSFDPGGGGDVSLVHLRGTPSEVITELLLRRDSEGRAGLLPRYRNSAGTLVLADVFATLNIGQTYRIFVGVRMTTATSLDLHVWIDGELVRRILTTSALMPAQVGTVMLGENFGAANDPITMAVDAVVITDDVKDAPSSESIHITTQVQQPVVQDLVQLYADAVETWTSSHPEVATVDSTGLVRRTSELGGEVVITASANGRSSTKTLVFAATQEPPAAPTTTTNTTTAEGTPHTVVSSTLLTVTVALPPEPLASIDDYRGRFLTYPLTNGFDGETIVGARPVTGEPTQVELVFDRQFRRQPLAGETVTISR